MTNLTTPKAIVIGFTLVAMSIVSLPYSNGIISPAFADLDATDLRMFRTELGGIKDAIIGLRDCTK